MQEQGKQAVVDNKRDVCGLMRMWGKNLTSMWQNEEVKAVVEIKEAAWQEVMGARDKVAKDRSLQGRKEKC